jgi:hypothetical protein
MEAGDINKNGPILKFLIHNAIVNSVSFVVNKCKKLKTKAQEPDFIASLTLNFTKELFKILTNLFPQSKFSITGIYCHQTPLADIGLAKNPEIGDLLLVYIHTDFRGIKKFNSLLLQAKISNTFLTTVSQSDEHQLKLYSEWPEFEYKRAGCLNGTKRNILPKTINDGAQYLLIDDDPIYGLAGRVGTFPMGCAVPNKKLNLNNDLSSEIIDFLKFKAGRNFEEDPLTSQDDWTKMIWDLINAAKFKAAKRANMGLLDFPRQHTYDYFDGCCYFTPESISICKDLHEELAFSGQNGDKKINSFTDENNVSPSVIIIESSDQKE